MQPFPKKGKKPKKPKSKQQTAQRERKKWLDATVRLASKLCFHRDKYCQWCGGNHRLGAHHIVAKGITGANKMAWFDIENLMLLCTACHIHKMKQMPDEYIVFRDTWLFNHGLNYKTMRIKYGTICKLPLSDVKIIYADLKRQCEAKGIEL